MRPYPFPHTLSCTNFIPVGVPILPGFLKPNLNPVVSRLSVQQKRPQRLPEAFRSWNVSLVFPGISNQAYLSISSPCGMVQRTGSDPGSSINLVTCCLTSLCFSFFTYASVSSQHPSHRVIPSIK